MLGGEGCRPVQKPYPPINVLGFSAPPPIACKLFLVTSVKIVAEPLMDLKPYNQNLKGKGQALLPW